MRILYGSQYAPSAVPLAILMASVPFAYLGAACGTALVAAGQQKWLLAGTAAAAVSNTVINLLLIPPLGMVGAAVATVVAYAAAWVIQWWYVHTRICPTSPVPVGALIETLCEAPGVLRRLWREA